MAFYIGRVGKTLALGDPMSVVFKGGLAANAGRQIVTLAGAAGPLNPTTDILRLRDQLLGLDGNLDEEVVPVIVDSEPRLTGYWKVLGVNLTTEPATLARGWLHYSIDLEQVTGFTNPLLESIFTGDLLKNAVGGVRSDARFFQSLPVAITEYFNGYVVAPYFVVSSEDGNLTMYGLMPSTTVVPWAKFYLSPANYYLGASRIEQGAVLQPVIGRQLLQNDTVNWRLSNGMVRVTPNGGKLDFSWWKGSSWSTPKTFRFTAGNGGLVNGFTSIAILRNSPEEVVIRLGCSLTNTVIYRMVLDLRLRRGDLLLRGLAWFDNGDTIAIARDVAEAATAITFGAVTAGGMMQTAADSDNNHWVMLSYQQAMTSDLVNGKLTSGTVSAADFAISSQISGSPVLVASFLGQAYLAVVSEAQRVVGR